MAAAPVAPAFTYERRSGADALALSRRVRAQYGRYHAPQPQRGVPGVALAAAAAVLHLPPGERLLLAECAPHDPATEADAGLPAGYAPLSVRWHLAGASLTLRGFGRRHLVTLGAADLNLRYARVVGPEQVR